MKVILTHDVAGLGGIGDVTDVAQGYANNYLIPRKLAVPATPGNLKHWGEKRAWIVKREAATRAEAEELAAKLESAKLDIVAKAGEEGRLYGSVTVKDIAAEILDEAKIEVDRKKIVLSEPIKSAGEHQATVRLHKDVDATITVNVVADVEASVPPADVAAVVVAETPAEGSAEAADAAEEDAASGAADQSET